MPSQLPAVARDTPAAAVDEGRSLQNADDTSVGLLSNARVLEWRHQGRKKNRKVGPVIIERTGRDPIIWSADHSEARKVIIWANTVPDVSETCTRLKEILSEEVLGTVVRVRNFGRDTSRRVEILCDETESRDRLLMELEAKPLGLEGERHRTGRRFEERFGASRTHREKRAQVQVEAPAQPNPLTLNNFAVLGIQELEGQGISIGVLNANGLSDLFPHLWSQANVAPLSLLAVTETYRCAGEKPYYLPGYQFLESQMRHGTRRMSKVDEDSHGVGIFVKNDWAKVIKPLEEPAKFADCLWVKMPRDVEFKKGDGNTHKVMVTTRELWIGVYYLAPLLSDEALLGCVQEMSYIIRRAGAVGAECVIVGDLNCCLRATDDPLYPKKDGSEMIRRAGELKELMSVHDLASLHELKPDCNLFTVTRGGIGRTMRDYVVTERASLGAWRAPFVHCDVDLNSDHWLLTTRRRDVIRAFPEIGRVVDAPVRERKGRYHNGWKLGSLCPQASAKHDPQSASRADELRSAIREGLIARRVIERSPDSSSDGDSDAPAEPESYEEWVAAVEAVLDQVLGRRENRRKRRPPSYFSDEVWDALAQRQVAFTAMRAAVNANAREDSIKELWNTYLETKTSAREACARAKSARWATFMDEIEAAPRGSRTFWRLLGQSKGEQDISRWHSVQDSKGNLISPDSPAYLPRWVEYCSELGRAKPTDKQSPLWDAITSEVNSEQFLSNPEVESSLLAEINGPITLEEVRAALDGLPNHKAIGADGFSNEVLKALGPEALHRTLSRVWEGELCPDAWTLAIIHPLKKPGDGTLLSNSRGISLMSCVAKLYESVLQKRLSKALDGSGAIDPEQCGFRTERECSDHILVLTEALRVRKADGLSTYVAFIDFAKAFDTVWRNALLYKLSNLGVRGKMLRVIKALYARTSAAVRVNGTFTDEFGVDLGVRQGGVLSPTLFLAFINDLIRDVKKANLGVKVIQFADRAGFKSPVLAGLLWADDVAILAESPKQLAEALAIVDTWCSNWLMKVNATKCNVMVFGPNPESAHAEFEKYCSTTPYKLGGDPVLPSKTYKYLGVLLSHDLSWDAAVNARADVVRRAIFAHSKVLRNRSLSTEIRYRYFDTVIMPAALWGSEFWGSEERLCDVMEARLAIATRMVCGAPPRASRGAVGWELGYAPVFLRAAVRRLRMLQKLKEIDLEKTPSGLWPHRVLLARSTKQWGWLRKTCSLAKSQLRAAVPGEALAGNLRTFSIDLKETLSAASVGWYRKWAKQDKLAKSRALLADIHSSDKGLALAPYLKHRGTLSNVLLQSRVGALMLNHRVSTFSAERAPYCYSCLPNIAKETLEHFILECPALDGEREDWASAWSSTPAQLSRVLDTLSAALGESAQFFEDLDPTEERSFQKGRMLSLLSMWNRRCALLEQRLPLTIANPNLTPRVQAL